MKTLIVGAGAVGGLFGAKLLENNADVQFLLRPARKAILDKHGLTVETPDESIRLQIPSLTSQTLPDNPNYDLIILSNKAYSLDSVIDDIRPLVGENTYILPLLNGLRHLETLDALFGADKVLGGIAMTIATLASPQHILASYNHSSLIIGARTEHQQSMAYRVWQLLSGTQINTQLSTAIMDDMWDKFCRITASGAANCLLQGKVCEYMLSNKGGTIALQLLDECSKVAAASGHPMQPDALDGFRKLLTNPKSHFNSSMYRDMRAGLPIEGDHLVSDMIRRGALVGLECPILSVAEAVLQTYSAKRT